MRDRGQATQPIHSTRKMNQAGDTPEVNKFCAELQTQFEGKEGETTWEERDKTLQNWQELIKNTKPSRENVDIVVEAVGRMMCSLRTTLALTSLSTVQVMVSELDLDADVVERLLDSLLKVSATTKKIVVTAAGDAVNHLLNHCPISNRHVNMIASKLAEKNAAFRAMIAGFLHIILKKGVSEKNLDVECLNMIETALRKSVIDANPSAREHGKQMVLLLRSHWPERLEAWQQDLDVSTRKSVDKMLEMPVQSNRPSFKDVIKAKKASLQELPTPTDELPTPTDELPTPTDELPTPTDESPTQSVQVLEKAFQATSLEPVSLNELPEEMPDSAATLQPAEPTLVEQWTEWLEIGKVGTHLSAFKDLDQVQQDEIVQLAQPRANPLALALLLMATTLDRANVRQMARKHLNSISETIQPDLISLVQHLHGASLARCLELVNQPSAEMIPIIDVALWDSSIEVRRQATLSCVKLIKNGLDVWTQLDEKTVRQKRRLIEQFL
jgi:hypothetical protein